MMFILRNYATSLVVFVLFSASNISAFAQTPADTPLVSNQSTEHEIKGGETQIFTVRIEANQTARVEIVQKGIDVSLAAINPRGERFIETESPSGFFGNDLILVTALDTGEYKIAVEPANPKAAAGKYQIKLAEIRPTLPQDNEINQATAQIEKAAQETSVLRQKGTREGLLQAIEKFQEIRRLAKIKQD
jgi:hypothetical protein